MRINEFVRQIQALKLPNTFNPYSEECPFHDRSGAAAIRTELLRAVLQAATKVEIDSLWIGRDLGYRGGRRTGLAFTDDCHLAMHAGRWCVESHRATKGNPVAEKSATVIWNVLSRIEHHIFLWNIFPLHPHLPDVPLSNRSHNANERTSGTRLLSCLIEILEPRCLVAIGRDANNFLQSLGDSHETFPVRHPSFGGHNIFREQIEALYEISK